MAKKKKQDVIVPEWPYLVEVEEIGTKPLKLSISPDKEQTQALIQRLGLVSLDTLEADIELVQQKGSGVVYAAGLVRAKLRQSCVVSMEPVEDEIEESFEAWYADPEQAVSFAKARHDKQVSKGRGEMPVLDEKEDPEPIVEGKIDIGELVTQYLSLSINPYPHAEGVEHEFTEDPKEGENAPDVRRNPFAALKEWKAKQE